MTAVVPAERPYMQRRRTNTRTFAWAGAETEVDRQATGWLNEQLVAAGWEAVELSRPAGVVIVWSSQPLTEDAQRRLVDLTKDGSHILLAGPTPAQVGVGEALAEAHGLTYGLRTPPHEVRIRSPRAGHGAAESRLSAEQILAVDKTADDVEVLLTANLALHEHPVATYRPATGIGTFALTGPTASPWPMDSRQEERTYLRLLLVTLDRLLDVDDPADRQPLRVGLLAFGAIGAEHARALQATPGLLLHSICDRSPARVDQARQMAPDVRIAPDADALLADPDVDLVIVSTPPDTHGEWALAALAAGKHVVVEKPFTLTAAQADAVLEAAAERDLLAVTYQNRRFDPDYLAIKRAVAQGRIGSIFHIETFVGGYGHPCNFWHSDQQVSGGAIFDWGAHVLDQLLDLLPDPIDNVTAAEHKLVWHDVSNADHSRVTLHFTNGAEAEFVHSDLAAALKPRWYVLGTKGAVVGDWRSVSVVERSEIGTLAEDRLAPADAPPTLTLHAEDGSVTRLATPEPPEYPFHRELSDYVHLGLPMSVQGRQSRRVVAVMAAARASAADGGRPVTIQ